MAVMPVIMMLVRMVVVLVMILLLMVLLNFRQSGDTAAIHAVMPYFSARNFCSDP
jgi:hypothetical protein